MPVDPCQSSYIYGLHDPGGEGIMEQAGVKGWILFTEAIGSDPNDRGGRDYSAYCNRGFGVIVRLNNGYAPAGTIPFANRYEDFAQRCANLVQNSRGCNVWIIGNETNYSIERPGGPNGEVITPPMFAKAYRLCRDAIRRVASGAQVLLGAVAPWNAETKYAGNPGGDWIQYFADTLRLLGRSNCDGFTLHAYTHGDNPALITSDARMDPPFQNDHYHFRVYQDFLAAVPFDMRDLPCYITESDQGDIPWTDRKSGWVKNAYAEIDRWNRQSGNQVIRSLILYRWPQVPGDRWGIDGKQGVIDDFRDALQARYTWPDKLVVLPVYRAVFLEHATPATLTANSVVSVRLRLRNEGSKAWLKGGPNPVHLGYHWLNAAGTAVPVPAGDFRSELPADVSPGSEVTIAAARLGVPSQPGTLTLSWDLVEEGVTWFKDRGSTPLNLAVQVKPMAEQPTEQFFEPTQHWVRGPFLDWFRRYGMDIAGYPITEQYTDPQTQLLTQYFQRVALEIAQGNIRLRLVGQQAFDCAQQVKQLQARVAQLEAQLAQGGGLIPQPAMTDISNTLPRDAGAMIQRPRGDIKYIVFNHTAVRPEVGADRVAAAHRKRWPAIVDQYFITADGSIQQTNPLTEVVARDTWIYSGVNIAIAGDFTTTVPSEAQLDAAASLVAWLLQDLKLAPDAVKGVSEFIVTGSPGRQWLSGQNYKQTLLSKVAAIKPAGGTGGSSTELAALRAQVLDLQQQLQTKQTRLDGLVAQVNDLQGQLQSRQQQLDDIRSQLQARQGQIDELTGQIINLQAENEDLRARLGTGGGQTGGGLVQPPAVRDVIDQLPRNAAASYIHRDLSQVQYLVINHTAVDPSVSVERIAQAHGRRWPGIAYQYYVQDDGSVLQTAQLEETVTDQQDWLLHGLQIGLAGNFQDAVPGAAQLDATARLCAWLLQRFKLPVAQVKGANELIVTASPGRQWLQGAAYKTTLVGKIQALLAATPPLGGDVAALQAEIARLNEALSRAQGDLRTVQAQLSDTQQTVSRLQTSLTQSDAQVKSLQARVTTLEQDKLTLQQQLQACLAGQGGTNPPPARIAQPAFANLVDSLPKSTIPGNVYATRPVSAITHLVVHHTAAPAEVGPDRLAAYHVNSRGWPGIGYHFFVGADGALAQTNKLETISYQAGGQNNYSIGVVFAGDFTAAPPTPLQIERGGYLIAWLAQELKISESNIMGHREMPGQQTACPGNQWLGGQQWKNLLFQRIRSLQSGTSDTAPAKYLYHYLLLWWRNASLWAQPDYGGAVNYVARFKPAIGFSVDEARLARYVTIVGGTGGVGGDVDGILRNAGVNVERVAGSDFNDTKRQLDELATSGRRFRTFDVPA